MRHIMGLLLSVVTLSGACERQAPPPAASAPPPASIVDPGAATTDGAAALPSVFAEAEARRLRSGDCMPGTGQHQIRGGPPPKADTPFVPCEPTPQLYERDPRQAKLLADFARARKGERR